MADEWTTRPLEDCMTALIDYRGKTPEKTSFGIPLITAKVVKGGRIETPDEFIAIKDYDEWMRRGIPEAGDVVITTEAPLGEVAQLGAERIALAQRIIALRGKSDVLDNGFLKFLMQSEGVQEQLRARASGTTVLGIKQRELRKISLTLPPVVEQRAIAHILGTLDDKIELTRRMNETLEAMARALFKSWFVDFDPVRAKAEGRDTGLPKAIADLFSHSFEDSELGEIPKGWEVGVLGDVISQRMERCVVSAETVSRPYVPIECISPKSLFLTESKSGEEAQSSLTRFYKGDLLFGAMRPYFHKVCIAPFDGTTRTTAFVLYPKREDDFSFSTLLLHDHETIDFATRHSTGSTIPYAVWTDSMETMPVVIPPDKVREAFDEVVKPILARIPQSYFELRTLRALRDGLLPKLISGEVRVKVAA